MTAKKSASPKAPAKKAKPKPKSALATLEKRVKQLEELAEKTDNILRHVRQVFIKSFGFDPSETVYREDAVAEFEIPPRPEAGE